MYYHYYRARNSIFNIVVGESKWSTCLFMLESMKNMFIKYGHGLDHFPRVYENMEKHKLSCLHCIQRQFQDL
jgi:hypothetical protein